MKTWIPFEEILEENMKIPGYAERLEAACKRLDDRIAAERLQTERTAMSKRPRLSPFAKKFRPPIHHNHAIVRHAVEA